MGKIDAKAVKESIKRIMQNHGPSLPMELSNILKMNSLFVSAFLSELSSEGEIKLSNMKVGGSPLYLLHGQEIQLENFTKYLKGKEQEACQMLKERRILEDEKLHPAIRVALRGLKDFAFAFSKDNRLYWRYLALKEENLAEEFENKFGIKKEPVKETIKEEIKEIKATVIDVKPEIKAESKEQLKINEQQNKELQKIRKELEEKDKELKRITEELEKKGELSPNKKEKISKKLRPKKEIKVDETFLNEVKSFLSRKSIELLNIDYFDKKQVTARIRVDRAEQLLMAYDKKRVEDDDLIKTYKKAVSLNMPYCILSKGEVSKKTKEAIDAYKMLSSMEKI